MRDGLICLVLRQGNFVDSNSPTSDPTSAGASRAPISSPPVPQNRRRRHDDKLDLWQLAHRALRGRYRLALMLATGGALAGAGIGALMGQRLYRATGLVRIAAVREQVMKETDQNRAMPMFDGFIQAQQEVMASRETVQAAMRDENWRPIIKSRHAVTDEQFAASLKVETHPRSDYLRVTYTDSNPQVAAAAVRSLISAYQRAYDGEENRLEQQRINELDNRRTAITNELKSIETEIGPVGTAPDAAGATAAIDPLYEAAAGRLKKFRAALVDVQCALAGGSDISARSAGPTMLPGEAVASTLMGAYAADQAQEEMELSRISRYGYGPSYPTIVRLKNAVREDQERVAKYAQSVENWRRLRTEAASPDTLKEQEATLVRLASTAEEEVNQLAARRARLEMLGHRATELQQGLSEVTARLDVLTTEASLGSRLTVVSGGDKPMTALLDNRPKAAAVGTALGAAAPLGILVLMATARRRYRNPLEVAEDLAARVPFVAVLPEVNDSDPAHTTAVARAVHQLRVRLQPGTAGASRVYLITSPAVGDGKSGLALSLGISFAAAGYRTLLVDGDLSGRRLTTEFNADGIAGAREVSSGDPITVRMLRSGLSFMSAGRCRTRDAYTLAPGPVARLLDRVRERFDIVLIDSDPLLAGVAAAVMSPQVDGVVLTVSRDQSHTLVREAMRLLEQQGAMMAGCVFNRAVDAQSRRIKSPGKRPSELPGDMKPGSSAMIETTEAETAVMANDGTLLPSRLRRFGPVVASVMSSLAFTSDDDLDLIAPGPSSGRPDISPEIAAAVSPTFQPRVA